jgi:CheY-like chemotaxis protein
VLLNLGVNARDAMPQGGTITLRVSNRAIDEVSAASIPGVTPGAYLVFDLSDTGTGIAADVLARIWEPFFTTKGTGRGTGLGLPTVRSIVESYRGTVALQSKVGRGTTFSVYLPALPGSGIDGEGELPAQVPRGKGELIMVVDDDENVRDVTGATLARHGYRVVAAASGTEAVALFAPRSLEIRLVVTDISMPDLDGIMLTRIIRNLNPSIRLLLMSGNSIETGRREQLPARLLTKPFTAGKLLGGVNELLAAPPPSPASTTVAT